MDLGEVGKVGQEKAFGGGGETGTFKQSVDGTVLCQYKTRWKPIIGHHTLHRSEGREENRQMKVPLR